ncbi:Phosphoenolpyruvate carboxykinase [ATP] [Smittium culicis]|uniref:Phosphoenolpyruvate carboxykinase (ATP) n=1 Tax=Smittium culicis TaxID=133412 RepID=A0A1R1YID0_9FUNG|nr:Phosphoenolpyruvate carboxykinase [ATP] [Smittium culicis]
MFYGIIDDTTEQTFKNEGIDLSRLDVNLNLSVARLYEDALKYEKGTVISNTGALITQSGRKTGRSPKDKRIAVDDETMDEIWWGPVNTQLSEHSFDVNHERAVDYLNTQDRVYVVDGYAGWDPKYRLKIRVVCSRPYHALFMYNMLIRPPVDELENFGTPDFTILNAGKFPANRFTEGMGSETSVALSFKKRQMVILGTEYAGEMKKGIFTVMHYYMPKAGVLSLHSSVNVGTDPSDVTLFFGLSGTGKTTLSADVKRFLIGDDEHCWSDDGVFNIEGGCYAKAINLSSEKEPEIFNAIRFGTVLENVTFDSLSHTVDYDSGLLTENTRASYPIEFIPNSMIPCIAGHPKNIVMLTCDAFGVLPPVSRLTSAQAMYHFISGYTAKVAGTEEGVTEPEATFSACFGQPFLVFHPVKYATMLAEKMKHHKTNVWLVNTGWNGGPFGIGSRISLKYSRAIIDAIHSGELENASYTTSPVFNLEIPTTCSNVPDAVLDPSKSWKPESGDYLESVRSLAKLFIKNFETFADQSTPDILESAPKL